MINPYIFPGLKKSLIPPDLAKKIRRKSVIEIDLFEAVEKKFSQTMEELRSPKRIRELSYTRNLMFYVLYHKYGSTLQSIAHEFRRVQHGNVINGIRVFKEVYKKDNNYRDKCNEIMWEIGMNTDKILEEDETGCGNSDN